MNVSCIRVIREPHKNTRWMKKIYEDNYEISLNLREENKDIIQYIYNDIHDMFEGDVVNNHLGSRQNATLERMSEYISNYVNLSYEDICDTVIISDNQGLSASYSMS